MKTQIRMAMAACTAVLAAAFATVPCFADVTDANGDDIATIVCGDYEYSIMVNSNDNDTQAACIEKYTGKDTDLVIPDTLDGLDVIALGDTAFAGNYSLKSVTLPVNLIGIGDYAFAECTALENYYTPEESVFFESRDGILYTQDGKWLVRYPIEQIPASVKVEDGIEKICASAFGFSRTLTDIEMPSTLTSIGVGAFSDCINLNHVDIPKGVTIIPAFAFYRCVKLDDIWMPSTITSIGECAFSETALEKITIPESCTSIGLCAFAATKLKSINIPSKVEEIGYSAFGYGLDSSRQLYALNDFVIYGALGSAASSYAKDVENGNHFEFVETNEPTPAADDTEESSKDDSSSKSDNKKKSDNKPDANITNHNKGTLIAIIGGGAVVLIGIITAIVIILRGGKKKKNEAEHK